MSSFCSAKATHIFSAKNFRKLYIESAKIVNEMALNELVNLATLWGVVGWCEGAVYLTSLGRPTDIGLQLGKACYPCTNVVGKGRGGMFLFLLFLHFHSCSSFFPVPLFHLLYSLFYLFSPFLWETTQNDPQGLTCR